MANNVTHHIGDFVSLARIRKCARVRALSLVRYSYIHVLVCAYIYIHKHKGMYLCVFMMVQSARAVAKDLSVHSRISTNVCVWLHIRVLAINQYKLQILECTCSPTGSIKCSDVCTHGLFCMEYSGTPGLFILGLSGLLSQDIGHRPNIGLFV